MNAKRLLNAAELEDSPVVANCTMNRERDLLGSNGYEVEVGFDPLEWLQRRLAKKSTVRLLDFRCGSGKALIQAAMACENLRGGTAIRLNHLCRWRFHGTLSESARGTQCWGDT